MYRLSITIAISALMIPLALAAQENPSKTAEPLPEGSGYEHAALLAQRGDHAPALRELRSLARSGDARAALLLGRMYVEARGVLPSREQGLAELRRLALVAEPDAVAYVGFRFLFDDSFPGYDPVEARRWFAAAAERGSAQGAFGLGLLYKHGRGITQSDSLAAEWFNRAANYGYMPAELMLAALHEDPSSPLFDPVIAEQKFALLKRDGWSQLIWNWADAYSGGARESYPVPVDHEEATRLRRHALRLGSSGGGAPLIAQTEGGEP